MKNVVKKDLIVSLHCHRTRVLLVWLNINQALEVKMLIKLTFSAFLAIITLKAKCVESYCNCPVNFKAVGCYKDRFHNRALPNLLLNERNAIDWHNWDEFMKGLACRCAAEAKRHGYKYFGLQFYGECWAGPSPEADKDYNKYGKGSSCMGNGYKECRPGSDYCTGKNNHNYIYEIEPAYNCPVKFERLGCYHDRNGNRALPVEMLNERSSIDWDNYKTFLRGFSCRCALKAAEKGYNTFGLQHYGECWSGPEVASNYYKHGRTSLCINTCYGECTNFNTFCMGKNSLNFVYRISNDTCEIPRTSDGCFNENRKNRALRELIINDVDSESGKFMGIFRNDYATWELYVEGLICRCARKTKEKGYSHFGIYNGGECWGGKRSELTYHKYGTSDMCYHDNTTPCTTPNQCVGREDTIFVYHI